MSKLPVGFFLLAILACGCAPKADQSTPSTSPAPAQDSPKPSPTSLVQVRTSTIGQLPNTSPQLPAVSPDGKWVAFLNFTGGEPPEPESLFTGRGLDSTSLHLQAVTKDAQSVIICNSGAAWPIWSADSKTLIFIAYTNTGRCGLVIYETHTSTIRRLSTSSEPIITPAESSSGTHAAVAVHDSQSQSWRLQVINLTTGRTEHTCPADSTTDQMLWPQWTPDGSIVFVLLQDGQGSIARWIPGRYPPGNWPKSTSLPRHWVLTRPSRASPVPSVPMPGISPITMLNRIASFCSVSQTFRTLYCPLLPGLAAGLAPSIS